MSLWKHVDKWGGPPEADAVTLGEGDTPLVRSRTIGPALGLRNLWFKYEGGNPTGSYKDRFAAAAVTHLRREGRRIVRKIVNVSSTSGTNGNAGQVNYSSGKAGIMGMTRTLAKEWGRYDVTVNAVAFGYIQTRLTKPLAEGEGGSIDIQGRTVRIGVQAGRIAAMSQMIPLGRGGTPEEAAGSVYLFCSPDSDYVSGQTLVVNGGL